MRQNGEYLPSRWRYYYCSSALVVQTLYHTLKPVGQQPKYERLELKYDFKNNYIKKKVKQVSWSKSRGFHIMQNFFLKSRHTVGGLDSLFPNF